MKSQELGVNTSDVEVAQISKHGLWLLVKGTEFFLPHCEYPWFKDAKVTDVLNVLLLHEDHLYWPTLDVDLSVDSLRHPDAYPLIYGWSNARLAEKPHETVFSVG
jgi:hypothetical protein